MNDFLKRYEQWGFAQQESIVLPKTIRINTLKKNTIQSFMKKIPYLTYGYTAQTDYSLASSLSYFQGEYYIQETASQIPVEILQPQKNSIIIDACAAPGSKTTQLAQYVQNTGTIIACDNHSGRLKKLQNNIERCGVTNTLIINKDAALLDSLNIQADYVLVDAPCSGNFAIDQKWFKKRTLQDIKKMSQQQKQILQSCWELVKQGGILMYTTCSLEIEENEHVIEWFLQYNTNATLQPITFPIGSPGLTTITKCCLRLWPTQHQTQGFFIAILKKG